MKKFIMTVILIWGAILLSCKSNSEPASSNVLKPSVPSEKDTPDAKKWVDNIKGKTFIRFSNNSDGTLSQTITYTFLENGNLEIKVVSSDESGYNTTQKQYFWGAKDSSNGIYYFESEYEKDKIYYEGYRLENNKLKIPYQEGRLAGSPDIKWDFSDKNYDEANLIE